MRFELEKFVNRIEPVSQEYKDKIINRLNNLTKPIGSLGLLENIVIKFGSIQETENPKIDKKKVYVFAGDHGITEENVSAYPSSVTPQMVLNFLNGGAAINILARQFNTDLKIVDVGVNYDFEKHDNLQISKIGYGTKNFLKEPAMTKDQALKSIFTGIQIAKECRDSQVDIIIAGEMGIGNTTASSAMASVICQNSAEEVTGKGTGINDSELQHKIEIIISALKNRNLNQENPLNILMEIGGFELGAIAGLSLGCAYYKIPLIADGFISTTGIALGSCFSKVVPDITFPVECTTEIGNKHLLEFLGLNPILSLNIRLGEGSGGIMLIPFFESAINLYKNMATFESAGVDKKSSK